MARPLEAITSVYKAEVKIDPLPDFKDNFYQTVVRPAQEAEKQRQALLAEQAAEALRTAPSVNYSYSSNASDVQNAIIKWANHYGVDPNWMLRVANCESGYTNATNYHYFSGGGHPHGVFQFLPQTFYGNGGTDYESYDDQARVAAYMFSIGQSGQWACK